MYILQNNTRDSVKVLLQGRGPKRSNDTRSLVIVDATVDEVAEMIREIVQLKSGTEETKTRRTRSSGQEKK